MAKLTPKEEAEILALLEKQVALRQKISQSVEDYTTALRDIKALQKNISHIESIRNKKQDEILKMSEKLADLNGDAKDELEEQIELENKKLDLLDSQIKKRKSDLKLIADAAREVNKGKMALVATAKSVSKIPDLISKGFGMLKTSGLFDMDKSMKMSAQQMGILSKQTDGFRNILKTSSYETQQIGVGLEELAAMQASFSEELGRTVVLAKSGNIAMAAMAKGTALGADGAAQMSSELDKVGYSVEKTAEFVEDTLNKTYKLGLNASKVIKTIQSNIKLLNRYNFRDGLKGLEKMVETTSKLGVQMDFASGFADKLFNIDGAVDMSAQLQVMGGKWSQLADPFKLMYMATNDMDGLTAALGNAAESAFRFDEATGEFKTSSLEIRRLKQIAEQTGVAYDELAKAGQNAAKYTKIKSQLNVDFKDKEIKDFLINTAKFQNGKAIINIDGNNKLISTLTKADENLLKAQISEKATLNKRAETAMNFDDKFNATINIFKTSLLPLVDELNKGLGPKLDSFIKKVIEGKWLDRISDFAKTIGGIISKIGGFFIDNPIITALAAIGPTILNAVGGSLIWFKNGLALSKGFNAGASLGGGLGGEVLNSAGNAMKGGKTAGFLMSKGSMIAGAGLGLGGLALDAMRGNVTDEGSTSDKLMGVGSSALKGASLGMIAGPWGAAIGGLLGGLYGAFTEFSKDAPKVGTPIHDGIYSSGKITPIDNKDDLIAYKPNGPIDTALKNNKSSDSTMNVTFSPIKIEFGDIKLVGSNGEEKNISLMLNDDSIIRILTRRIQEELTKSVNGGKLSSNPSR